LKEEHYIHRDLSWLSFNYRLLQEAKDRNVPLYDRMKFLAIYSSNLDEFFRVRVASLKNLIKVGKKTKKSLDYAPKEVLTNVLDTVNAQQVEFSEIFQNEIIPDLKKEGVTIGHPKNLSDAQLKFIENYFCDILLPFIQPMLLKGNKIKPFLNTGSLYLVVELEDKELEAGALQHCIVKIPSDYTNRFVVLPSEKKGEEIIMLLDDIIRHCQKDIFPGYNIVESYSIKLTRDAELYIDDEFEGDLIEKIRKNLNKRKVGLASRLVYDREMPIHLLEYLMGVFEIDEVDLTPEGRYHNNSDFFKFNKFLKADLHEPELTPLIINDLVNGSIFQKIDERDYLIHVPYHSYLPVINFFEQAAVDPTVTDIKIIQYRVAKESRIMNALLKGVKNGKKVTAFIEIKARFDEEANIEWGEKLQEAGVDVYYSMPGLKVHSKMALIRREIKGEEQYFGFLSTGNFHEVTAKLYSDLGIFTANKELLAEAVRIFKYLETKKRPKQDFKLLAVGTFDLKPKLKKLVKNEISNAKAGKKASIILKMNSLQDREMIDLLYDAGRAGVKITLIVRGICCIIPGIPNYSNNIEAFGIIDRFLEHARVFIFSNDGDELIYLASADWMGRNLHRRVETMIPILEKNIKNQIKDIINIQMLDNVKSRRIHYKKNNNYRKVKSGETIRSQMETYNYLIKQVNEQNAL